MDSKNCGFTQIVYLTNTADIICFLINAMLLNSLISQNKLTFNAHTHTSSAIITALYPKPTEGLSNDLYKNVQF